MFKKLKNLYKVIFIFSALTGFIASGLLFKQPVQKPKFSYPTSEVMTVAPKKQNQSLIYDTGFEPTGHLSRFTGDFEPDSPRKPNQDQSASETKRSAVKRKRKAAKEAKEKEKMQKLMEKVSIAIYAYIIYMLITKN
uniref:Uncharacterized protein n=1 Tax=Caulerpa manorensis TaxID=717648 RepID=A0A2P0QIC1_9CHLO|nr:hypothetical protein [Caulerpa manorensis]ARO74501.1 hypothetical protein [Caulerpa manorensis]